MTRSVAWFAGICAVALVSVSLADDLVEMKHPDCPFFGPEHDKVVSGATRGFRYGRPVGLSARDRSLSALTESVSGAVAPPPGTRTGSLVDPATASTIDRYLFQAMADSKVTPAPVTNDFEFMRRVSLDLTGRIPTPDAVRSFVADTSSDKRAKYIEGLLASPQWVDKWTMYFGDFFQNNSRNTQVVRFQDGVTAFNTYIRDSLSSGKPYNQMAREIIAAQGTNSYTQGEINWLVGGTVTGGPVQDVWDQQAANVGQTFLGIAHVNCVLCHNGRGHLDSLSLWGSQTTRMQAWGLSSFLSRTTMPRTTVSTNVNYFGLTDNPRAVNYALNTTTGNRPARQPVGTVRNVPPAYLWGGQAPSGGQNYRDALAQYVTTDFQFARAAVNYMWVQFFGLGIVDPPDQFDIDRLDPSNPPTAPWPSDPTQAWPLQPSNPQLLTELAQDFINSKYDLKVLMREIVNSQAYQLSSRYNGTWNPQWAPLFARKMVRRLWAEELHDAVTQTSGLIPSYNLGAVYGTVNQALQLPEPFNMPDGGNGAVNNFLNAFLRGNRDDQTRRAEGSISQALDLMNDNFIMSRVQLSRAPKSGLLAQVQALPNDQAVNTMFLTVLSRYPTTQEMTAAMANLTNPAKRNLELENLLWSLYNKVDFIFNY